MGNLCSFFSKKSTPKKKIEKLTDLNFELLLGISPEFGSLIYEIINLKTIKYKKKLEKLMNNRLKQDFIFAYLKYIGHVITQLKRGPLLTKELNQIEERLNEVTECYEKWNEKYPSDHIKEIKVITHVLKDIKNFLNYEKKIDECSE
jgi:uncharacterized protein (UPF0305 family)